jgi:hypothetical protein
MLASGKSIAVKKLVMLIYSKISTSYAKEYFNDGESLDEEI